MNTRENDSNTNRYHPDGYKYNLCKNVHAFPVTTRSIGSKTYNVKDLTYLQLDI